LGSGVWGFALGQLCAGQTQPRSITLGFRVREKFANGATSLSQLTAGGSDGSDAGPTRRRTACDHFAAPGRITTCEVAPLLTIISTLWLNGGGETLKDLAWSYKTPVPENAKIAGLIAFYNERADFIVDGERQVRPKTKFS
jgi:hypothetical protein